MQTSLDLHELRTRMAAIRTDVARIDFLRGWVYSRLVVASRQCLLPESAWRDTAVGPGHLLRLFERNIGGVWCSGASTLMRSICESFGFRTASVHLGDPDGHASHVVTLVELRKGHQSVWSVQDAYFNYTIEDRLGDPIDYRRLWDTLEAGDSSRLRIRSGNTPHCWILYAPEREDYSRDEWEFVNWRVRNPQRLSDGRVKAAFHSWNLDVLQEPIFAHYPAWLQKYNGNTDPIGLFRFPFYWNAPADLAESLDARCRIARSDAA